MSLQKWSETSPKLSTVRKKKYAVEVELSSAAGSKPKPAGTLTNNKVERKLGLNKQREEKRSKTAEQIDSSNSVRGTKRRKMNAEVLLVIALYS